MNCICQERKILRATNDRLQRENDKLWDRIRLMEKRLDKISIEQFVFVYAPMGDPELIKALLGFSKSVRR